MTFTITPASLDAYKLLHNGILALSDAEISGVCVDVDYCKSKIIHLDKQKNRCERKFEESKFVQDWKKRYGLKFNMNSNTQLGCMLFDVYKFKSYKKTKTGKPSTDEEALQQIDLPAIQHLLRMKKIKKNKDYLLGFLREQVNGVINPFFNLHNVITYRSSMDSPNLQNIPARDFEAMEIVRKAIIPRKGHQLRAFDFSGIEVAIAACYHKDRTMLKYLRTPGSDMHGDVAKQLFKIKDFNTKAFKEHDFLRKATKNSFVFPQFYGDYYKTNAIGLAYTWGGLPRLDPDEKWGEGKGCDMPGSRKLSDHLNDVGLTSLQALENHVQTVEEDFWKNRFYEYAQWKLNILKEYQENGYITSLTGFKYSGIMRKNEVINYPVQGSAFHCLLWSFIQVNKVLKQKKMDTRLVLQIHDEMVFDQNPDEHDYITEIIYNVTYKLLPEMWKWIIVPLEIEEEICPIDGSWNLKKKIKKK